MNAFLRVIAAVAMIACAAAVSAEEVPMGDDGLHKPAWFSLTFKDIAEDMEAAKSQGKRLALMFEQRGCIYCKEVHETVLTVPEVRDYIKEHFMVVQYNIHGSEDLTDLDGETLSEKRAAKKWRLLFTPTILFMPEDVPTDGSMYSQDRARLDILAVLDGLGIAQAHIVGLSMGGFATLHFGLHHPDRALSLVVAGCGYGAERDKREQFQKEAEATAQFIGQATGEQFAAKYALGPTRVQFQNKDPRGWAEFRDQLAEHSLQGAALTMRGVQKSRPSLFDLTDALQKLTVPTLIITGDEDAPCLIPNVFMKRTIPAAALVIMPNAGHTINLEDPDRFNREVSEFLAQVTAGRWPQRDPRAQADSILGDSILGTAEK